MRFILDVIAIFIVPGAMSRLFTGHQSAVLEICDVERRDLTSISF